MRVRYEWNPRSGMDGNIFDEDAPEPELVTGEGEIVGCYNDEYRGPCFVLSEGGGFRIMAISACKPIDALGEFLRDVCGAKP